jgi:hypothetical protein
MTFGHHGIFSLTPVYLLAMIGGMLLVVRDRRQLRWIALAALALTVIVVLFYMSRPMHQRNYGGMTCGLRWTFWLIPLWLMMLPTCLDVLDKFRPAGSASAAGSPTRRSPFPSPRPPTRRSTRGSTPGYMNTGKPWGGYNKPSGEPGGVSPRIRAADVADGILAVIRRITF